MDFPGAQTYSLIINLSTVMDQEILPCGQYIPDSQKIFRDPRVIPRAKPERNLEGRGKSRGRRGWISQYLPSFGGVRTFYQETSFLQGVEQEILQPITMVPIENLGIYIFCNT